MVTGLLSMMLALDTGTAAEAEAVIAIAAGAKSAKITLRIGHSFSLKSANHKEKDGAGNPASSTVGGRRLKVDRSAHDYRQIGRSCEQGAP